MGETARELGEEAAAHVAVVHFLRRRARDWALFREPWRFHFHHFLFGDFVYFAFGKL